MEKKFRPCVVEGKRGIFHGWFQYDGVRLNNSGRMIDGNVKFLSGLVEFEDGSVKRVDPESIKFEDSEDFFNSRGPLFKFLTGREWFDNYEPKSSPLKAKWVSITPLNVDIYKAECSYCGYVERVYGSTDNLSKHCHWCNSEMSV